VVGIEIWLVLKLMQSLSETEADERASKKQICCEQVYDEKYNLQRSKRK
jgi:hypothetical protein